MRKNPIYLVITVLGLFALMVALLPLTIYLTGGREIRDFSPVDSVIFWSFIGAEIVIVIFLLVFSDMLGKLLFPQNADLTRAQRSSKTQTTIRRRNLLLVILALAVAWFAFFGGAAARRSGMVMDRELVISIIFVLIGFTVLCGVLGWVLFHAMQKKFEHMEVAQLQDWMRSHREQADTVAAQKRKQAQRIRVGTDIFAAILSFIGLIGEFCTSQIQGIKAPLFLVFFMMIALGTTRIRFRPPRKLFEEAGHYVFEKDYPALYSLAHRAAAAQHVTEEIRIALNANDIASVSRIGNVISIELGAVLMGLLTEQEMYHVLLHELSHVQDKGIAKEHAYYDWLQNESGEHLFRLISKLLFLWPDAKYKLTHSLYRFASSLGEESRADREMLRLGDPTVAASMLLKLKYADLYEWEHEAEDHAAPEDIERKAHDLISDRIRNVQSAFSERCERYRDLTEKEILSRTASHPTVIMRLNALGISDLSLVESADREAYRYEVEKAINEAEAALIERNSEEEYTSYLEELLETVSNWEEAGRPIGDDYPDVINALKELGRLTEAMELCDRVDQELPKGSNKDYALYMKGCWLLHCWDPSGIDWIYRAIKDNSNYLEEGLDQIGSFCCISGNQQELDRYRERALILVQKNKDVFSQISVLKKGDRLSGEQLPSDLEHRICRALEELDHGQIDRIYLLHKEITADFFTSAMVVQFFTETQMDQRNETMHRIFLTLDAVDNWQFSLFDYDEVKAVKPDEIPESLFYLHHN